MSERLWPYGDYSVRVEAPHFCAYLEIEAEQCIFAAPILKWCVSKPADELRRYFKRKGWHATRWPTKKPDA